MYFHGTFINYLLINVLILSAKGLSKLQVVGGRNATDKEFPYTVSLRGENQLHYCGGSIISQKWILTAGHCTQFAQYVHYGTVWLNDGESLNTIKVKNQILHPSFYSDLIPYYDLGLLELVEPLSFNDLVQPVSLPTKNQPIPFNQSGILTGWGFLANEKSTDILQEVDLILFDDHYCDFQLNVNINNSYFDSEFNFCAGDWENTKGQCTMDSGGPLTINGTQWGVVSWSYKPCAVLPGVFTRLGNPEFREWIRNVTGI
ncbi:trypsin 5G1-like [Anthonomus grandis grandis]|uniref:trypsin 5G1-like n=1 Tax=Anthonomus grandis grandis TaxID=2921223 RepID=UPI0021658907|nr:trypsin 5G1-like [Anthonomus grandis grandis]